MDNNNAQINALQSFADFLRNDPDAWFYYNELMRRIAVLREEEVNDV